MTLFTEAERLAMLPARNKLPTPVASWNSVHPGELGFSPAYSVDQVRAYALAAADAREAAVLQKLNPELEALRRQVKALTHEAWVWNQSLTSLLADCAWRPISTAPKDGTDILLTNGVVVSEGHWLFREGGITEHRDLEGRYVGQDEDDGHEGWIDWNGGMSPEPTGWRPKPSPSGVSAHPAPVAQSEDVERLRSVDDSIWRNMMAALQQAIDGHYSPELDELDCGILLELARLFLHSDPASEFTPTERAACEQCGSDPHKMDCTAGLDLFPLLTPETPEQIYARVLADAEAAEPCHVTPADALEFRREQYGFTQAQMAAVLGIQPSHYSEIVNGRRQPSRAAMQRAVAVGVPAVALLGLDPLHTSGKEPT